MAVGSGPCGSASGAAGVLGKLDVAALTAEFVGTGGAVATESDSRTKPPLDPAGAGASSAVDGAASSVNVADVGVMDAIVPGASGVAVASVLPPKFPAEPERSDVVATARAVGVGSEAESVTKVWLAVGVNVSASGLGTTVARSITMDGLVDVGMISSADVGCGVGENGTVGPATTPIGSVGTA